MANPADSARAHRDAVPGRFRQPVQQLRVPLSRAVRHPGGLLGRPGELGRDRLRYRQHRRVYFQTFPTFALHVQASGLSPAVYGALLSLNGAVIIVLELPLATFTRRLPVRPTIATGLLLIGIGSASMLWPERCRSLSSR